jgi:hypothetical protein
VLAAAEHVREPDGTAACALNDRRAGFGLSLVGLDVAN